ncbi:hypothetical protein BU15DRAFT_67208 [Melanogaster broomeanus]|nr:hypothetical protein BU15DRAFT_67208 [Melanogaster broomeanus]
MEYIPWPPYIDGSTTPQPAQYLWGTALGLLNTYGVQPSACSIPMGTALGPPNTYGSSIPWPIQYLWVTHTSAHPVYMGYITGPTQYRWVIHSLAHQPYHWEWADSYHMEFNYISANPYPMDTSCSSAHLRLTRQRQLFVNLSCPYTTVQCTTWARFVAGFFNSEAAIAPTMKVITFCGFDVGSSDAYMRGNTTVGGGVGGCGGSRVSSTSHGDSQVDALKSSSCIARAVDGHYSDGFSVIGEISPALPSNTQTALPAVILPVQTHRSPDYLDILDLPATSRRPVSGPAASRPTSTLKALRASLKSIRESFRGDQPKVTPIYQGKAPAHRASHPAIYQRHAAAEETPRPSQLPANMPTTPGHYGTYTILAAAPPTDTRSPDDDPIEVTAETAGHAAFCGLCSKLPFRRSKHPNNSGARNPVVEIPST